MTLRPSSLTSRLVATVVGLVALVGLLVAGITTLAMHDYLSDQLDSAVQGTAGRGVRPFEGEPRFQVPPSSEEQGEDADGDRDADLDVRGQSAGTLTAIFSDRLTRGDVITQTAGLRAISTTGMAVLSDVPADGQLHTVDLPALGEYRVKAEERDGATLVFGLPTRGIADTVSSLVGWQVLLVLLGVTSAAVAGTVLVQRHLRPLRSVAGTAHEVARLPLDTGEIGTTVRVPDELTDPGTEVGQVGEALNTLLAHMEAALDARHRSEQQVRQFVADASHELRTPLATIQGYAELARRVPAGQGAHGGSGGAPVDPGRLLVVLDKVESEAHRMSALVEDLLLLARLDAGRPLASDDVDLTRLAVEAVVDARVVGPDHRWLLDLPDSPVHVTGDAQRLHQLLSNLLANARRHTPPGTVVTVGLVPGPGHVELTVHDDGPGLPPDLGQDAFERFTRGDGARTRTSGGAGLGLSLVRAIAEAHHGRARVDSRPGSTTFTVRLPRS